MKKIIMLIMMVLCSSLVMSAIDYSYDTDHFGNTKFFQGTSGSAGLWIGNRTYCQGFRATETGTITEVSLYTINTDCELNYCLSGSLSYPNDECYGSGGTVYDAPLPIPMTVSVNTIAGEYYYMCVQANEVYGGSNCYVPHYSGWTFPEPMNSYFGVTTNINDLDGVDTIQSLHLEAYYDYQSGGAYVGWATNNRVLREIQYCYGADNCYMFSPSIAGTFTNCNPPSNGFVGQVFNYAHDTEVINNVSLILTQGSANNPTDKFQIELYEWNTTTNTTGISLYNSSQINFSIFSGYNNWTFITHDFNQSIQLVEDKSYIIGARCVVGCSGALNERIFFFRYVNPNGVGDDWFGHGFQDNEGFFYIEGLGNVKEAEDGFFLFGMGGDVWTEPTAPTGNCSSITCTTWESPYALREEFNGYINFCDWVTSENLCHAGYLSREQTDDYYTIFKLVDLVEDSVTRYVTVAFDIKPDDIATNGKVSISLTDSDGQKFIQLLISENGTMYNNEEGNAILKYSNMSTTLSKTVNLHIDFTDDNYDLWYDGSKVASNLAFVDSFLNIENLYGVRVSSIVAGFELDNLEVYASDQNNNLAIVDIDPDVVVVDENLKMCGLFHVSRPSCSVDSDCETGHCSPDGHCNSFDMTYCDENGYTRGNKCYLAGITSCILESTTDIILDNFLLFLVLIIIIVLLAYVFFAFSGGNN